jgi:hypothetical protein
MSSLFSVCAVGPVLALQLILTLRLQQGYDGTPSKSGWRDPRADDQAHERCSINTPRQTCSLPLISSQLTFC